MFQVFQMTKGESSDELVLGDPSPHDETTKVKRRNRVLQSCIPCHELRRKCDRQRPCTRCSDHGMAGQCVYQLEDPAARTASTDELTRLRRRVAELEHTVRVLTSRYPREALEEKMGGAKLSLPPDEEDTKHKRPTIGQSLQSTMGVNIPGRSPSSSGQPPAGSPRGSPGGHLAGTAHCGCALSSAGREILGQLQTNLNGSIQRLKALPEHRGHGVNCPLYVQAMNLQDHLRQSMGSASASSQGYAASHSLSTSYGLQSPYAASSSTQSSASPPGGSHDFYTAPMGQGGPTFDLGSPVQPSQPYPYTGSNPSSISGTLSHSLSHPHISSSSSASHPHSYAQMGAIAGPAGGYPQYQPQSTPQQSQQGSSTMGSVPGPGASGSLPYSGYTSLSTWNSVDPNERGASQRTSSSKQSRSSGRTAK